MQLFTKKLKKSFYKCLEAVSKILNLSPSIIRFKHKIYSTLVNTSCYRMVPALIIQKYFVKNLWNLHLILDKYKRLYSITTLDFELRCKPAQIILLK